MHKRFQVAALFHPAQHYEPSEWIPVNKQLPEGNSGLFLVRRANGDEVLAYYFKDKMENFRIYSSHELTHWYKSDTKEALYNITHWGKK